jgi:glycosyltransferase involved in cell wall biosynthesis
LILQNNNISSGYYKFYALKSKIEEIAYLNLYDHVVTFSPIDREKLIKAGVNVPCTASFLIVDSRSHLAFRPASNRITFLGSGGHMPNRVGLDWFLKNEWQGLLKNNSKLTLSVIGNWNYKIQKEIHDKYSNVHFLGFVDDLQKVMTGSIMIVPITIGSGIRIKILECASVGVPFVSTAIGVEGLPFKDGLDCFIADDSDEFSRKLTNLLEDKEKQREFSENSLKIIQEQFSKEAFQKSRMSIYNKLFE